MIVTCPDCATRYDVEDTAFSSGGRAVRCNHCGCEWYQIGPSGYQHYARTAEARRVAETDDLTRIQDMRAPAPSRLDDGDGRADQRLGLSAGMTKHQQDQLTQEPLPQTDVRPSRRPQIRRDARSGRLDGAEPEFSGASDRLSPPLTADSWERDAPRGAEPRRGTQSAPPAGRDKAGNEKSRASGGATMKLGVALIAAGLIAAPIAAYHFDLLGGLSIGKNSSDVDNREPVNAAFASAGGIGGDQAQTVREGVVFAESKFDLVTRPEGPALEVWGRVANNGPGDVLSPTIEIVSRDEDGTALQRWLAQPDIEMLAPGESAQFSSRMMYPLGPVNTVDFYIAAR